MESIKGDHWLQNPTELRISNLCNRILYKELFPSNRISPDFQSGKCNRNATKELEFPTGKGLAENEWIFNRVQGPNVVAPQISYINWAKGASIMHSLLQKPHKSATNNP